MSRITDVHRSQPLFALYDKARANGDSVSDVEMLEAIKKTYWGTNA